MFPKSAPDVAILDSVVLPEKLPKCVSLTQVSVRNGYIEPLDSVEACDQEHGTVCSRIIASGQDSLSILAIDIFGECSFSTLDKLILGLKYAITKKPRIIHLSVGLEKINRKKELEGICKSARHQGIILVAATSCKHRVWPACFDSVIAVGAEEEAPEGRNVEDMEEYWNLLVPGVDNQTGIRGSSIAAAFVTQHLLKGLRSSGKQIPMK